jgi:hypothetical protein
MNQQTKDNKTMEANNLAKIANENNLGRLSSTVWLECCRKFGCGGTIGANNAYEKIMKNILKLLLSK